MDRAVVVVCIYFVHLYFAFVFSSRKHRENVFIWCIYLTRLVLVLIIGDQLRLILPISGGHSSNLPRRLLCPCGGILFYPSAGDIRLLYLQVGAVRLLYPSAEDIRLLYLQVVAACPIDLQYCTKLGHPLRGKRFILILGIKKILGGLRPPRPPTGLHTRPLTRPRSRPLRGLRLGFFEDSPSNLPIGCARPSNLPIGCASPSISAIRGGVRLTHLFRDASV